jgi:hypothetical protein
MIELRECEGFLAEASSWSRVSGQRRRQHLERDVPVEMLVVREVHDPHPTGADALDDAEVSENLTKHRGFREES